MRFYVVSRAWVINHHEPKTFFLKGIPCSQQMYPGKNYGDDSFLNNNKLTPKYWTTNEINKNFRVRITNSVCRNSRPIKRLDRP